MVMNSPQRGRNVIRNTLIGEISPSMQAVLFKNIENINIVK